MTTSAERYVKNHALSEAMGAIALGRDCTAGDLVSLVYGTAQHHFVVLRRRWIVGGEEMLLEITLDHPARVGIMRL